MVTNTAMIPAAPMDPAAAKVESAPANVRPSSVKFWQRAGVTIGNILLTLLAFPLVLAATSGILYFAVTRMSLNERNEHVPVSFALIPIFGLVGGIVGAITRENCVHLCRFRDSSTFDLGVVGNAITGLGGAAAVMFVFGISEFSIIPLRQGRW